MELEGVDVLTVRDGLIQSNDAFTDTMSVPRQIGMMPPLGSPAEQRLTSAFNVKTRLTASVGGGEAELVATGVWVVQGQPGRCNVFLIENGGAEGGVTLFDAGARTMTRAVASAGAKLGGIRGWCSATATPTTVALRPPWARPCCATQMRCRTQRAAVAFATGRPTSRGCRRPSARSTAAAPLRLGRRPGEIADTVSEGDEVSGFSVIDLPGHAPGLIGLWRESDRLALVSDLFYTFDMWGRNCAPRLAEEMYNYDSEQARASIRKLAELEPAVAWAGHAKPVTGDVRGQLLSGLRRPA